MSPLRFYLFHRQTMNANTIKLLAKCMGSVLLTFISLFSIIRNVYIFFSDFLTHSSLIGVHSCIYVGIIDLPLQTNGTVEHQEVETAVRHVGGMGRVEDELSSEVPEVHLYNIFYTEYHLFVLV